MLIFVWNILCTLTWKRIPVGINARELHRKQAVLSRVVKLALVHILVKSPTVSEMTFYPFCLVLPTSQRFKGWYTSTLKAYCATILCFCFFRLRVWEGSTEGGGERTAFRHLLHHLPCILSACHLVVHSAAAFLLLFGLAQHLADRFTQFQRRR